MVKKFRVILLLLLLASLPLIIHIPQVHGDTFTVMNLNDSGDGSLRWAIEQANLNRGVDVIEFDSSLSGTIILESPLPQITEAVIIDGSTAGGPIIIDGSNNGVTSGFTITVWWGTTLVESLTIQGFTEYGIIITSGLDEVVLENLIIKECGYGGIIVIRYGWGPQTFNVNIKSCEIYNNQGVGVAVRASGVTISDCKIYNNRGAGIYATVDEENSGIVGPTVEDAYIYYNYAEGILIQGNVSSSYVGSNVIEYNGFGGVTITSDTTGGPTKNIIEENRIKFNKFQGIAIVGEGTASNRVKSNYITSDETTIEALGIVVKGGADSNVIEYNIISNHRIEGIAIVGPDTDDNIVQFNYVGAFDEYGNPTGDRSDGNGAGILVGSAAAPAIHYPFPVYGSSLYGPKGTTLRENWVLNNRGAGIILIRTIDFTTIKNTVEDNELWGFYWVGSSGVARDNVVKGNDLDGFRIEPYYGESASPEPPGTDDDVLSSGIITENTIQNNGGYGIIFLDNPPWLFPETLPINNVFSDNKLGRIGYYWLSYGKVLSAFDRPVIGKTIVLLKNDGDSMADYVWSTYDSEGRYGPSGFAYGSISTWERIISGEIDNDGVFHEYNPYRFLLDGELVAEIYAWDGLYPNPPGESGGAIESPANSGIYRYQYVQLQLRKIALVGGEICLPNKSVALGSQVALIGLLSIIVCLASSVLIAVKKRRRWTGKT